MIGPYSKISKIGINRNRTANGFPNGVFKYFEIMFATFRFLHIDDLKAVPLYDNLRF